MKFAARTDRGLVREINEDSFSIIEGSTEAPYVFIIADGMGGHNCGEIASRTAVEYIRNSLTSGAGLILSDDSCENELRKLVKDANTAVYQKSLEQPEANGMGTTLTMAAVAAETMIIAHVGDSRLYQIRNGNIVRVTEDHSYIEELIRKGSLTRKEAENHPRRHVITRAIGCLPELDIDITRLKIENNDIFVLCTDGLSNMVSESEIAETVRREEPDAACEQLVESAKRHGGEDNISVIVIKCE